MVDARRCRFHRCAKLRRERKDPEDGVGPPLRRALFVSCEVHRVRAQQAAAPPVLAGRVENVTPPLACPPLPWPAYRRQVLANLGARRDPEGYGLPWHGAARPIRGEPARDRIFSRTCDAHAAKAVLLRRPLGYAPN